jgi:hypothetical protein
LHESIFDSDRLLVPNVRIKIRLVRSNDAFALLSQTPNANYKIIITELTFRVKYIEVRPDIAQTLEQKLTSQPAFYSMPSYIEERAFSIEQGITSKTLVNLFNSRIPRRLIMVLVLNNELNGLYNKDPYRLMPHDLQNLAVRIDNNYFPLHPIRMDWDKDLYLDAFNSLQRSLGRDFADLSNGITYKSYKKGNCIFGIDLTASGDTNCWHTLRLGELAVSLTFSSETSENLSAIFLGEFSRSFFIHGNRYCEMDSF